MAGYPTPPPTSSPKSHSNKTSDRKLPAHFHESYDTPAEPQYPPPEPYLQQSYDAPTPAEPKLQAQEPYYQPSQHYPPAQETYFQNLEPQLPAQEASHQQIGPQLPAQETYYHSYSTPASPNHWDPSSKPIPNNTNINAASTVHFDSLPPRRKSSPIQHQNPSYYETKPPFPRPSSTGVSPNTSPQFFPAPPRKRTPTRSLYSSPLNGTPTPCSTSRPSPRPGLWKRITRKLEEWIRTFMRWSKLNPIKAGLLTFIPVIATAGMVKLGKEIGKLLGGGKRVLGKADALKAAEKKWGYGFDEFAGFAGAKKQDGPMAGLLKTLHMLVNHYCKLSPSAVPRLASILLELYFLEVGKAKL